jgi:hypothetical protein
MGEPTEGVRAALVVWLLPLLDSPYMGMGLHTCLLYYLCTCDMMTPMVDDSCVCSVLVPDVRLNPGSMVDSVFDACTL